MGVEEGLCSGIEGGQRPRRDGHPVPDAADLEEHLAGHRPVEDDPAQGSDHALPSLAQAWAMARANPGATPEAGATPVLPTAARSGPADRWQMASARASA